MAKYAAAGSLGARLMTPSIPGVGLVTGVRDLVWSLSPKDLRLRNEKALLAMGADEALIKRFFDNPNYTPSDQTRIVAALEVMKGAEGRALFVGGTAAAESPTEAMVYSRTAEILAAYHSRRSPIKRFVASGRTFPLALTGAGTAVLMVPADHVGWTELTDQGARAYTKIATEGGVGNKLELWVEGRVSDRTRDELGKLGWVVFDRALEKLGG